MSLSRSAKKGRSRVGTCCFVISVDAQSWLRDPGNGQQHAIDHCTCNLCLHASMRTAGVCVTTTVDISPRTLFLIAHAKRNVNRVGARRVAQRLFGLMRVWAFLVGNQQLLWQAKTHGCPFQKKKVCVLFRICQIIFLICISSEKCQLTVKNHFFSDMVEQTIASLILVDHHLVVFHFNRQICYLENKFFWWWSLLVLCLQSEAFLHKLHALRGLHLTENVFCVFSWLSIQVRVAGKCCTYLTLNPLIGCVCFSNWNRCAHVFIMCFAVGVNVSDMWVVFGSVAT